LPPAAPAPPPDRKKARRIETIGLIGFVCFVVMVKAIGQPPLAYKQGSLGVLHAWNWLSVIGIVVAVLDVVLLTPRVKLVWSLPPLTRSLTLIGLAGLVLHAALAISHPPTSAADLQREADPQGCRHLAPGGAEDWIVEGKPYHIASTCYLKLPTGEIQYHIFLEHPLPPGNPPKKEDALAIARPFILYAYTMGYHLRASTAPARGEPLVAQGIGVSLFERQRGTICRVDMPMDQIRWRAAAEAPSSEPSPPAGESSSSAPSPAPAELPAAAQPPATEPASQP
jgi:hypothetical protein